MFNRHRFSLQALTSAAALWFMLAAPAHASVVVPSTLHYLVNISGNETNGAGDFSLTFTVSDFNFFTDTSTTLVSETWNFGTGDPNPFGFSPALGNVGAPSTSSDFGTRTASFTDTLSFSFTPSAIPFGDVLTLDESTTGNFFGGGRFDGDLFATTISPFEDAGTLHPGQSGGMALTLTDPGFTGFAIAAVSGAPEVNAGQAAAPLALAAGLLLLLGDRRRTVASR